MAIQIPNPGTGNGATGDNEFVLWSKVKDNFNNSTHAASRLVGTASGSLAEYGSGGYGLSRLGYGGESARHAVDSEDLLLAELLKNGSHFYRATNNTGNKICHQNGASVFVKTFSTFMSVSASYLGVGIRVATGDNRALDGSLEFPIFTYNLWTDRNTRLDSNGSLKPSSPVLEIYHDKMIANDDGNAMAATYIKNGVGDYTITGTTGLRTDGWYVVIPNDMNGNPLVAIGTLDDTDGVITLKTYVRIFDMTTFKFVPDLEQPLDIPDGRWIDLRFNDLPDELIPQEV